MSNVETTPEVSAQKQRGRKPAGAEAKPPVEIPPALAEEVNKDANLVAMAQEAVSVDQLALAQQLGSMNAFNYMARMSSLGITKWLAGLKENKAAWKGLEVLNAKGEKVTLNTFEDLCGVVGISRAKADADILNLAVLGEEFLEAAKGLGLGYREIRQIRQLPADERGLMFLEDGKTLRTDDPEILKDWLEDTLAKNAKVKDELKNREADQKAMEKVLETKGKALDAAQTQLAKLKSLEPDARMALMAEKEAKGREEMAAQGAEVLALFGRFLATAVGVQSMAGVTPAAAMAAHTGVASLCESLAGMLPEYGYDIDFTGMVFPEWMEQAAGNKPENSN